jgi:glycosyltransferase involved in cell wall biosynthesis
MNKISVCMPCFNTAPFLHARHDSLLAQTHEDFELVILDSESSDGSWAIIREYARRDSRIRACQQPRRGIWEDWNACLKMARCEWIYIATSDDTMRPDALATFMAAATQHPTATVIGSRRWVIDGQGEELVDMESWDRAWSGARYWTSGWCERSREVLHCLLVGPPFCSMTQLFINRGVFDRAGWFASDCYASGDFMWQFRMIMAEQIYFLAAPLGSWRRHESQYSQVRGAGRPEVTRHMLESMRSARHGYKIQIALGVAAGIYAPDEVAGLSKLSALSAWLFGGRGYWFRPRWRQLLAAGVRLLPGGRKISEHSC